MVHAFIACCVLLTACAQPSPPTLSLYASLPLTGPAGPRAQAIVKGFEIALAQRGYTACNARYRLRFVPLDYTTGGVWDATLETAAANKAATDSTAIAFLGSFEPAPLLLSLPILNKAGPLLIVAPMNTYPPLTYTRLQSDDPDEHYPTGLRNLVRLGPTDFQIGEAATRWAAQTGARAVYILYDLYDPTLQGLNVARAFEHRAAALGLTVAGTFGLDRYAAEYDSVMDRIGQESGPALPSLIFYAGPPADHLRALFAAKIAWLGDQAQTPILSAPGFAAQEFVAAAGPSAEGMFVLAPALPPAEEQPGGHEFVEAFTAAYGAAPTDEAVYGYSAADLILTAAEAVCSADRNAVRLAAMKARRDSLTTASGYLGAAPIEYGIYRAKGGTLELLERVLDGE